MNHLQLQKSLALLIRLPDHNRENLDEFLASQPLSLAEKENLRVLASNRELNKFAFKMRMFRVENIIDYIPLTLEHVKKDDFIKFVETKFDPEHTHVFARKIYRSFRQFIYGLKQQTDRTEIEACLGSLPPFFFDLLIFETIDGEFDLQGFADEPVSEISPLQHSKFEVLSLDYKIHKFVEKKRNKKASIAEPKKGASHLLFLINDNEFGYEMFEIDRIGAEFLINARNGVSSQRPDYYDDFVEAGLCR